LRDLPALARDLERLETAVRRDLERSWNEEGGMNVSWRATAGTALVFRSNVVHYGLPMRASRLATSCACSSNQASGRRAPWVTSRHSLAAATGSRSNTQSESDSRLVISFQV
jgi:hypothetical protein